MNVRFNPTATGPVSINCGFEELPSQKMLAWVYSLTWVNRVDDDDSGIHLAALMEVIVIIEILIYYNTTNLIAT